MIQLIFGSLLLILGLFFSSHGKRPWIDYDFALSWYGLLLFLDALVVLKKGKSLFQPFQGYVHLAFSSAFFWWFYEWINIFLKNWAYPQLSLYNQVEFGILASTAFTTVIPLLILSTNFLRKYLCIKPVIWKQGSFNKVFAYTGIVLGVVILLLCIFYPAYFFPFTWFILFFIFDSINGLQKKRSLCVQLIKRNATPLLILTLSGILAGFLWETMNHFIPKWTYPITPWFWTLPAPFTIKYFQMPLAGFIGYVPFMWSAFAFVEFLGLHTSWLEEK